MPKVADEIKFIGDASTIALEECQANLPGNDAGEYLTGLWQRYQDAGKPADRRTWLKKELMAWFPAVGQRPVWAGRKKYPQWPWYNGRPMTFIAQMDAPSASLPTGQIISKRVLYIFLAAGPALVPTANGWTAKYTVVDVDPTSPW